MFKFFVFQISGVSHFVEVDVHTASSIPLSHPHALTSDARIITFAHMSTGQLSDTRTITSARIGIDHGQSSSVTGGTAVVAGSHSGLSPATGVSTAASISDNSAVSSQSASLRLSGIDRLMANTETIMLSGEDNLASLIEGRNINGASDSVVILAADPVPGACVFWE